MNIRLTILCLGGFLALTPFVAPPALADEWNKRTEFQFSAPVQIPGKTLAAGKYAFRLADSESDRTIVQIFSEDSSGNKSLVATLMAIPDYIEQTPDKPVFNLKSGRPARPRRFIVGIIRARKLAGSSSIPNTSLRNRTERIPPGLPVRWVTPPIVPRKVGQHGLSTSKVSRRFRNRREQ